MFRLANRVAAEKCDAPNMILTNIFFNFREIILPGFICSYNEKLGDYFFRGQTFKNGIYPMIFFRRG